MDRRRFLHVAAGITLAAKPLSANAQAAWPSHAMTIVVPFAPGGQADLAARPLALGLAKILEQSVVVDNRPGAGGAIGAAAVLKSEPDVFGYDDLVAARLAYDADGAVRHRGFARSRACVGTQADLRDVAVEADRARARRSEPSDCIGHLAIQDREGYC